MAQKPDGWMSIPTYPYREVTLGRDQQPYDRNFKSPQASRWDHGDSQFSFTHQNKNVAKTGKSHSPKQAFIKPNGRKGGK